MTLKLSLAYAVREEVGFEALAEAPIVEVLNLLRENGFEGIELNIANPLKFNVKEYSRVLEDYGIRVTAISTGLSYLTYGYSLTHKDTSIREKAIEFFEKYAEIAFNMGCRYVVIGLARGKGNDKPLHESLRLLKESIEKILTKTEKYNIMLLLEPLNRYETKIINNVDEFVKFLELLDPGTRPRVKMLFDTFHMFIEETDVYHAFLKARKYVGYIHVAENNRLAPGMGCIDWLKFLAVVKASGYDYYISVEAIPKPDLRTMISTASKTLMNIVKLLD